MTDYIKSKIFFDEITGNRSFRVNYRDEIKLLTIRY